MPDTGKIQYITQEHIDKKKWDACISSASNGLVYAYSFYLDQMAKQWDGLVLNDYEMVMPLPYRKKWNIFYLFQPFLTPELGVFGSTANPGIVDRFLASIPAKFKLWDISLNHYNRPGETFKRQYTRSNYVLSLQLPYEDLRKNYSENLQRNIEKAKRTGHVLDKNVPFRDIIGLCSKEWPKFTKVEPGIFESLSNNFSVFSPFARSYGVYSNKGKLTCSCIFLICGKRAYYWLVGNDPTARGTGASPMLIDAFIHDHAGKDMIFDFEGSDKKSIAEFYKRFNAQYQPYTTIYCNFLPFPANLLKKVPQGYRSLIL